MRNSDLFLDAFNSIQKYLQRVTGLARENSFSVMVTKATETDSAVRQHKDDLREFNDLRNAIVHETRGGKPIAEPIEWAVEEIKRIKELLHKPPRLYSMFKSNVYKLSVGDPISTAVKEMYKRSFSQAPVYGEENFEGLLTTNTIARWLGARVEDDVFSLSETQIREVLGYEEGEENCQFLSRNSTVFDAVDLLHGYEYKGQRLEAILITENGKSTEKPLGIITVWDFRKLFSKVLREGKIV